MYSKDMRVSSGGKLLIKTGSHLELYTRSHFDTFDDTKKEAFMQQLAAWHIPLEEYLNQFHPGP